MKGTFYSLLLLLMPVLFACKKNITESAPVPVQPIKRPAGNSLGAAVVQTIGTAGGTIESVDKRIKITVPEGALASATTLSVQPVENTLTETTRPSFRLLPEGVVFQKPVTVVFSYAGTELAGTTPDLLRLAYQDAGGIYHLVTETAVDLTHQTLSTQTTHFSDWTFVEELKVEVDKPELKVGESAVLKLMQYETLITPLVKDPPLGAYVDYYLQAQVSRIQWSLAVGSGQLRADGIRSTYTAPPAMPAVNPALVSVTVPVRNPARNDYSSQAIITVPITVVEDEYLVYTLDGMAHVNNRGNCATPSCINMEADNFYINAEMKSRQYILIRLLGNSFGTRSYAYGLEDNQAYIMLSAGEAYDWMSSKVPCETCDEQHSSGSVKLTRYDAVGGYVEGEFTAELWYQDGSYNPPKKEIAGKFRVKRTQ